MIKKITIVINLLSIMLLGSGLMRSVMAGEIYSYIDANGVQNFTNRAPKTSNRVTVKYYPEEETTMKEDADIYNCLQSDEHSCFTDKSAGVNPGVKTFLGSNGNDSFTEEQPTVAKLIYKCVKNGITSYTDKPHRNSRCEIIDQKNGNPNGNHIASSTAFDVDQAVNVSIPQRYENYVDQAVNVSIPQRYENYKDLIEEAAYDTDLDPALLHAVIQTESAYKPEAVSPKGAVGLMQLMPATARRFGVTDRTDVTDNVYGGARFLRYLLNLFDNDFELALAGYNAGENAVKRYGYKIPPYRETKNYVKKVMRLYRVYRDRI